MYEPEKVLELWDMFAMLDGCANGVVRDGVDADGVVVVVPPAGVVTVEVRLLWVRIDLLELGSGCLKC